MHVVDGRILTLKLGYTHDFNDLEDLTAEDYELKPEEPRKAREWLDVSAVRCASCSGPHFTYDVEGNPTLIEKLPGSVQVTREMLMEAWEYTARKSGDGFTIFCRALGLSEGEE